MTVTLPCSYLIGAVTQSALNPKYDNIQDREHVVLPRQPDRTSSALLAKLAITKVMEFTSETLRSGVVVWSDDGPQGSALLFLRGAPAVIRNLVEETTVPEDFNQVGESCAQAGVCKRCIRALT